MFWANPPIPKWEWSVACSAVQGTLLHPLLRSCNKHGAMMYLIYEDTSKGEKIVFQ
jgi:hypothetical protein